MLLTEEEAKKMTGLSALIARLEAATEGSRELSDEILFVLGWRCSWVGGAPSEYYDTTSWFPPGATHHTDGVYGNRRLDFTRSLDAAVTLVPEGHLWNLRSFTEFYIADVWIQNSGNVEAEGFSKLPALALCIAALKARQGGG